MVTPLTSAVYGTTLSAALLAPLPSGGQHALVSNINGQRRGIAVLIYLHQIKTKKLHALHALKHLHEKFTKNKVKRVDLTPSSTQNRTDPAKGVNESLSPKLIVTFDFQCCHQKLFMHVSVLCHSLPVLLNMFSKQIVIL